MVSGTSLLAMDPMGDLGGEMRPSWITLVCLVHPTDAQLDWDLGNYVHWVFWCIFIVASTDFFSVFCASLDFPWDWTEWVAFCSLQAWVSLGFP